MTTATEEAILLSAGSVEIEAAAAPAIPRVTIVAYTGGVMTVPGWGPVVIDLSKLDGAGEQIGILADHDSTLRGIVGHGQARVEDRPSNLRLTAHRVDRHQRALQFQHFKEFRNRGDLVALFIDNRLPEADVIGGRPRADHVDRVGGKETAKKRNRSRNSDALPRTILHHRPIW